MADKILVVDDEPDVLRLMTLYLRAQGYEVTSAKNGLEALASVASSRPDLVILDVMMPEMSGLEVCSALRQRPEGSDLLVIMLSALTQVPDKVKGLRAGADDYVAKPVSMDELGARVSALLARARRLRSAAPAKSGRILGFLGAKGGVGTSTIALNVASLLCQQKKPAILIELRASYGTLSRQLKLTPPENLGKLAALEANRLDGRLLSNCLYKLPSGLRVLFGPQKVDEYKELDPDWVTELIGQVSKLAEFVLLDLPSPPSSVHHAALSCCDAVALVLEPEATSLSSAAQQLELLRSWHVSQGNTALIICNRGSSRLGMTIGDVRNQLNCQILGLVPAAGEGCAMAVERGTPLVQLRPDDLASSALSEITNSLTADRLVGITA